MGATRTSASTFTDFYSGFIYSMKAFNEETDIAAVDTSSSCSGGCSPCPVDGVCLGDCSIGKYEDSGC